MGVFPSRRHCSLNVGLPRPLTPMWEPQARHQFMSALERRRFSFVLTVRLSCREGISVDYVTEAVTVSNCVVGTCSISRVSICCSS